MTKPLDPALRKQLENAVRWARRVAEDGASAALGALAVDAPRPHGSMTEDERTLRRKLRAHGRQLGDERNGLTSEQEIERLVHEVAYEHWHRMLFARFLAENGLLIEPELRVAVSLEECAELAREGLGLDGWEVAESFVAGMLPEIFRPDDPALAVTLAPETRQKLEKLVADLPKAVFVATDSLGWTYQFWQTDRKDEVNRSEVKIGADELPAVTQLFTEPYMVRFLFHNTVGAWRAGRMLAKRPELARDAADEAELAEAVRIAPAGDVASYDFEYLRFVREPTAMDDGDPLVGGPLEEGGQNGEPGAGEVPRNASGLLAGEEGSQAAKPKGPWRPAAGAFEDWPDRVADLRVLDPCCGSGHFLVEALELLARLRMEEEGLGVEAAVEAVLRDNLFGLEIDLRCTQIAAFNLALAAWKMVGWPIDLPPLQIACSGLGLRASKEEWLRLAEGNQGLEGALDKLYELFGDAPTLGSLIDPAGLGRGLFRADYETAEELLTRALDREGDEEEFERAVAAQGMVAAAKLLAGKYDLVITNVPYLARAKQDAPLQAFGDRSHPDAKKEIATMFVSRILGWVGEGGAQAVVVPQSWLFLTSYRRLRERLLRERTWRLVARLGPGAFETISGHVVNVALTVLSAETPGDDWLIAGIDVSAPRGEALILAREKEELLRNTLGAPIRLVAQARQLLNPDAVVKLLDSGSADGALLKERASGLAGILNGDSPRFRRMVWEFGRRPPEWALQQTSVDETCLFGGHSGLIYFDEENGHLREDATIRRERLHDSDRRGNAAWGRVGIGISQMTTLPVTLYSGAKFDSNLAVVLPAEEALGTPIWCYCSSPEYSRAVREIDQKLNVTNATLVKVGFDLAHWQKVAAQNYPNGLPEPYSDDPTQWLFHGHPCGSVVWDEDAKWTSPGPLRTDASVLQVAVARLLGYRWPAELDPDMRLAAESMEWVRRCEKLHEFADEDGIVCLDAAASEPPAAERLRRLLAAAHGEKWSSTKEEELLAAAASTANRKRPAASLEVWLRDHFFAEHAKLFHNRPFIWHVWDGRRDGFNALINCHRLCGPDGEGRRTLQALTYRHLGEWITRQLVAQAADEEGADARLAAAQDLQGQLERILEGEPPCDIFVRWRPLHEQPVGWEPNLDDGVRLDIRPFMRAELQSGGRKGAGILRVKPNVKWGKDRGKEPEKLRPRESFPWFYSCPGQGSETDRTDYAASLEAAYDGSRWNDLHYTRAAKEAARKSTRRCTVGSTGTTGDLHKSAAGCLVRGE